MSITLLLIRKEVRAAIKIFDMILAGDETFQRVPKRFDGVDDDGQPLLQGLPAHLGSIRDIQNIEIAPSLLRRRFSRASRVISRQFLPMFID